MFLKLVISALSVGITAWMMDSVTVEPWWATLLVAIVMGVINSVIRPVVKFFSIPISIMTLGLFVFVINAMMVMLCSWCLGDYFKVDGFMSALLFSIVLSLVGWVLNMFVPKDKKKKTT